ncbi:hypothetical protein HY636_04860 [Candidatus Woesearchaeota archaeon]|nr:hypothetical protein [Candidatus Woesearchaeota archaeon]
MVKDKTMIRDKSITNKIKKTVVGALAGASMFVGGEAIAQEIAQNNPQPPQEIQQSQQVQQYQQETQEASAFYFSEQERKFNEASYNLGFYMLWKDQNLDGKVQTVELFNVQDDISSDPKLLENAVKLTQEGAKLSQEIKPHNQTYIKKIKSKAKSAEDAYKKDSSEENKQRLRKALRDSDGTSRQRAKHTIDFSVLPEAYQRIAWKLLYKVTPHVEKVFLAEKDPNNLRYRTELIEKGDFSDYHSFWDNGGSWCFKKEKKKSEQWKDELCSSHPDFPKKVPNAGQWPSSFTQEDINRMKISSDDGILRHFVNVVWDSTGKLMWDSINNSPYYKEELKKVSKELEGLLNIQGIDPSLRNFFLTRANEFLDLINPSPFQAGDLAWIMLNSIMGTSPLEVNAGFNEEYHGAFAMIAMMEMTVGVVDQSYTQVGQKFKPFLQPTEDKIGKWLGEDYKIHNYSNFQPPIVFANVVLSGDGRCEYVAAAWKFPNIVPYGRDEFYKNLIELNNITARLNLISLPMAKIVMDEKQLEDLSGEDSLIWAVAHEISHGLGPGGNYKTKNGKKLQEALGEYAHALEEAKADLLGMALLGQAVRLGLISEEEWNKALFSIIPSYLRGLSYGVDDPHGTGSILQFAELYKAGVIEETPEGKYKINLDSPKLYDAFYETALKIMTIQKEGDYSAADNWVKESQKQLPKLLQEKHIPVIEEMPRDVYLWYSFTFSLNVERDMMQGMMSETQKR